MAREEGTVEHNVLENHWSNRTVQTVGPWDFDRNDTKYDYKWIQIEWICISVEWQCDECLLHNERRNQDNELQLCQQPICIHPHYEGRPDVWSLGHFYEED